VGFLARSSVIELLAFSLFLVAPPRATFSWAIDARPASA